MAAQGYWRQPVVVSLAAMKELVSASERLAQPPMEPPDEDSVRHVVREPRPGVGLYLDRAAEMCARNVDGWYLELAHHQVKERVRHFAERIAPDIDPRETVARIVQMNDLPSSEVLVGQEIYLPS